MSIGELVSMYRDGELDLHPEFQRFFRWTPEQKSRFIESLLLGIPVPPIFVTERSDSKWDVIDGLQRLSTVLQVMGELKKEDGTFYPPLELSRTHYLSELKGAAWKSTNPTQELPESAKIRIKRARLDVNIIKSTSGDLAKYEIFQRLNTGGAKATDQEVRNCLLLMTNRDFFTWIRELGARDHFRACVPLTDRALDEAFDLELVVRFIVLSNATSAELSAIDELGSFLTSKILEYAQDPSFNQTANESAFELVFNFLSTHLNSDAFRRFDKARSKYTGAMLISLFEVVAAGLGHQILLGKQLPNSGALTVAHKELWYDAALTQHAGSGVRASTRIPKTVEYGRGWL
ncbi:DUF262 domain-containing protein [Corallococcus praedator]|uniref:DUF262 domain-containing protein n=2 Tax=Myxococcaceae TaxID=31 RepID=A0ABX9QMB9_9BACT|nr:DUF262 domain-containing protein [Corallococcus exiguus]RKH35649.1 DUF262 domain-containing protein [Corallococcus sp. CA031C]RKI13334.1 DUF262 domain-containing protein [Corallococcus praedator]